MLRENYEIGVKIASEEVSTFRALARLSRQPVMIHLLPAEAERQRHWQERIRERQLIGSDDLILGIGEHEGRPYLVTGEIPRFVGFAEWIKTHPVPTRGATDQVSATKPGWSESENPELFGSQVGATELLSRAAAPPKRKRDYQPPKPNQPSEYSKQFSPSKAVTPPRQPVVFPPGVATPIPPAPPGAEEASAMAQALVIANLQDQLRLWRSFALIAGGFAVVSLVALLILIVHQS